MRKIQKPLLIATTIIWICLFYVGKAMAWDAKGLNTQDKGHFWITQKALLYLAERNLLPIEMDDPNEQYLIMYGNHFADNPWVGLPNSPQIDAANHMMPNHRLACMTETERCHAVCGPDEQGTISCKETCEIIINEEKCIYGKKTLNVVVNPLGVDHETKGTATIRWVMKPSAALQLSVNLEGGEPLEWAQDNLYHHSFSDLSLLNDPTIDDRQLDLRLFPLSGNMLPVECTDSDVNFAICIFATPILLDIYRDAVADKLKDTALVSNSEFGLVKYGAILYQLSRKFFSMSHAEPSINELLHAGDHASGWRTGDLFIETPLNEGAMIAPSTYLGGMPYVCKRSNIIDADPCRDGSPTWPPWVPEDGSLSGQIKTYPGRSDRVGLIYLGWAAHMIQDVANPHHAANLTGPMHAATDDNGSKIPSLTSFYLCIDGSVDTRVTIFDDGNCGLTSYPPIRKINIDEYMKTGLDNLLGSAAQPLDRFTICDSFGLADNQIIPGELNWEATQDVFVESMMNSYSVRGTTMQASINSAIPRIRDAIHSTMKLLLCAPSRTLSPALIATITNIYL